MLGFLRAWDSSESNPQAEGILTCPLHHALSGAYARSAASPLFRLRLWEDRAADAGPGHSAA